MAVNVQNIALNMSQYADNQLGWYVILADSTESPKRTP
jgi:hypothetical protein